MPTEYQYPHFRISFPSSAQPNTHDPSKAAGNVAAAAAAVALVEIDRPEKLHSFKREMWLNLREIFVRLSHDAAVRCVVLSSTGERAFTAGLDVQSLSQDGFTSAKDGSFGGGGGEGREDPARVANRTRRHLLEFQECITAIENCEKPVICLLHGICYGLAIDISLAADIRLAASSARFSVKEVDIGIAADIGTLTRLPHANVSMSWIKQVCLTARDFGAHEARQVGLISGDKVFGSKEELQLAGLDLACEIAAKSPVAVLGTKNIINYSREHGVEDGLKYTAVWNAAYTQTDDVKKSLSASRRRGKNAGQGQQTRIRFEKL